jgi:hypothetical protein
MRRSSSCSKSFSAPIHCHRADLLGHTATVNTTMIYRHVLNRGGKGVNSPLIVCDKLERWPK